MFSKRFAVIALLMLMGTLSGCDDIGSDLSPSGLDKRPLVTSGDGSYPGQTARDFTAITTLSDHFTLSDQLLGGSNQADSVVLYFTMWCPICLAHTDHLLSVVMPQFASKNIRFVLVDYVSGSVLVSRSTELANGYGNSDLITLVDRDLALFNQFDAAMGSTVVIDPSGLILMNEDYKNGEQLTALLEQL